jgi:hypothetical protein
MAKRLRAGPALLYAWYPGLDGGNALSVYRLAT